MRLLYKFQARGVYFSKNGAKAFQRGEMPSVLIAEADRGRATGNHHIARRRGDGSYTRELVMFYEKGANPCGLPQTPNGEK